MFQGKGFWQIVRTGFKFNQFMKIKLNFEKYNSVYKNKTKVATLKDNYWGYGRGLKTLYFPPPKRAVYCISPL